MVIKHPTDFPRKAPPPLCCFRGIREEEEGTAKYKEIIIQVSMWWSKQRKNQNADAAEILSTFSNFLAIIF